jgi:hypothetical protein
VDDGQKEGAAFKRAFAAAGICELGPKLARTISTLPSAA